MKEKQLDSMNLTDAVCENNATKSDLTDCMIKNSDTTICTNEALNDKEFEILKGIYGKIKEHSDDKRYTFVDLCALTDDENERCYLSFASTLFDGVLFEGKEYHERKASQLKKLIELGLVEFCEKKCTIDGYLKRYDDPMERDFYKKHLKGFIKGNDWLVGLEKEVRIKGFMQEEVKLTSFGKRFCSVCFGI